MKIITESQFFSDFMKISHELTTSEIRMLYLLIAEPYIIEFPQQVFADRIQTHRRTINIGFRKLKALHYVKDDIIPQDEELESEVIAGDDAILEQERTTAIKVIINAFEDYYKINKKDFTINEDYYSFVMGDNRISLRLRNDKHFITNTLRVKYPEIKFYFDLKKSDYENGHFYMLRLFNHEVIRARNNWSYAINTKDLVQKIYDYCSVEKDESLAIIKSAFPKIRISERRISLRKPWKGKGW